MSGRAAGPWFEVPARTRPAECKGCGATIHWIASPTGRRMPIDCAVDGGAPPTDRWPGTGISHHATCPEAARFRRAR